MKYKMPNILYIAKAVMVIALLLTLSFSSVQVSAVLFCVAIAFSFCDFMINALYYKDNSGKFSSIISFVLDRVIVLLPLVFYIFYGILVAWVFAIIVVFEIAINLYKFFDETTGNKKLAGNLIYAVYNVAMYVSILTLMFSFEKVGIYSLFVATIIGAIYIVYSSINFSTIDDDEDTVIDTKYESDGVVEKISDSTASQDQIVE